MMEKHTGWLQRTIFNTNFYLLYPKTEPSWIGNIRLKSLLSKGKIVCIGSGITKTKTILEDEKIQFLEEHYSMDDLLALATLKWEAKQFEDLAYVSPSYLKEYYFKPLVK